MIYAVNVIGGINNIQYASRLMTRKKSGSIINIASIIGRLGNAGQLVYGSSKSAVIGITYSAAKELAPLNINVNAIAPGFFSTEQNRFLLFDDKGELTERGKLIIAHTPMEKFGEAQDLIGALIYLASDASKFVTGVVLPIDGGFSAFSGV